MMTAPRVRGPPSACEKRPDTSLDSSELAFERDFFFSWTESPLDAELLLASLSFGSFMDMREI